MIRVLVADNSPVKRRLIRAILESDPQIMVVGEARDGEEALRLCRLIQPDLATMDLSMPKMDGIVAISQIMRETPLPIVALTSSSLAKNNFRALEAGALLILNTPQGASGADPDAAQLIAKVKSLAGVKVARRNARTPPGERGRETGLPAHVGRLGTGSLSLERKPRIIAIGASTGGPPALRSIFSGLSAAYPLPIVVVQHISVGFATGLAQWLASTTSMRVKIAEPGEMLQAGVVYLGPEERHFMVQSGHVYLGDGAQVDGHCPSATVLFESVAQSYQQNAVGILLTGMGEDGARGLLRMRQVGAHTIAQDETSSVIFGMPKAAIVKGAAIETLSLEAIPGWLNRLRDAPGLSAPG